MQKRKIVATYLRYLDIIKKYIRYIKNISIDIDGIFTFLHNRLEDTLL